MHRHPEGQGQNAVTRAQSQTGGWGYQDSRFYHDSLSCWFFYFASCLSITAKLIPYYKDKEIKYKQLWHITRPKWVKVKIVVIILSLLLKNENKDTHYKYT